MPFRICRAILLSLLTTPLALPWGIDAHRLTARIATLHLETKAAAAVAEILGPSRTLADVSNLADDVRKTQPATSPWHYVDIPFDAEGFDRRRDCPGDQCLIAAIERFRDELKQPGRRPEARFEALHNLVHFMGDIHQPFHCVSRHDHGGNDVKAILLGRHTNLHQVWDSGILRYLEPDTEAQFERLREISPANLRVWSGGTPETWALESHRLAREVGYHFAGNSHGEVVLGRSYARRAAPVVERQLQIAAIRIAVVLNNIFR